MKFKRVLLKLSGESLSSGFGIDRKQCESVSRSIKKCVGLGLELAIVIGGGNFWRGRTGTEISRIRSDQMGMLATSMNALCLSDFLERLKIKTLIQSSVGINGILKRFSIDDTLKALKKGKVVIFSSGIGEPFFSTDTCAALRAGEIRADAIFKATNVDGIYSADPKIDKEAKKYASISFDEVLEKNLKVMDMTAISLCRENNIPILVFKFDDLERVSGGANLGSLVSNCIFE